MFRKITIIIGSLIALVLIALVVLPFVIDVDKYRPQIVNAVDERINGKLELGKLKLSLWGQVRVEVGGLTLSDSTG